MERLERAEWEQVCWAHLKLITKMKTLEALKFEGKVFRGLELEKGKENLFGSLFVLYYFKISLDLL